MSDKKVNVVELRETIPFTTIHEPCCTTDELAALLDVAEAYHAYEQIAFSFRAGTGSNWPDVDLANRKARAALARLDFGDA